MYFLTQDPWGNLCLCPRAESKVAFGVKCQTDHSVELCKNMEIIRNYKTINRINRLVCNVGTKTF